MRALLPFSLVALLLAGCTGNLSLPAGDSAPAGDKSAAVDRLAEGPGPRDGPSNSSDKDTPKPDAGGCSNSGPAYLHGDLWPFWYNHRVKCDPEHRNYWLCLKVKGEKGSGDCSKEKAIYSACDVTKVVYGEYGAPQHDTRKYDYDKLFNSFYGGKWGALKYNRFATLKVFKGYLQPPASGKALYKKEILAFSSNPGEPCAYMKDTKNSVQGGCMMAAPNSSDRFGAFAWIKLPTGQKLTVAGLWLPMGPEFPGCSEYTAGTCLPRKSGPAKGQTIMPCYCFVHVIPEPGRHYLWAASGIKKLPGCGGPPKVITDRFKAAGKDVSKASACP